MKSKKFEPNVIFMNVAIAEAMFGIYNGDGGPFGACIVETKTNKIIAAAHNEVLKSQNATQHAEIVCITKASQKLKRWNLSGCTLYTTTECCPMCFSAAHWAQIDNIVSGTTIEDVARIGFNEIAVSNKQMNQYGGNKITLYEGYFKEECQRLLDEYVNLDNRELY